MAKKKHNQEAVESALDEIQYQLLAAHDAPLGAQAGLGKFNAKKFLQNLHIVVDAVAPFLPTPIGPIVTAIDEVLGKLNVSGGDTAASADSSDGFDEEE